jgi:integrase
MSNLAEKLNDSGVVNSTPVPNVVGINNESTSVKILNYLEDKKRKSKSTHEAYQRYFKEFFKYSCNKEISQITWDDIFSVDYSKVDDYKNYLLTKGVKPYYVEQKLFACKALWEKLYHINRNIDLRAWDFEREEYEENHYAALSDEEMNLLFDFAKQEEYKPMTKMMYFRFLYIVGCRKHVPLELEWKNIIRKFDKKNKVELWVAKFHDKGKWVEKSINDDFYNELLELKTSGESKENRVFDINKNTIESVFNRYQEKYNLLIKVLF